MRGDRVLTCRCLVCDVGVQGLRERDSAFRLSAMPGMDVRMTYMFLVSHWLTY